FVMFVESAHESGLLIALEAFLLTSRRPNAWAVVEFDFAQDRWAVQLGADVKISDFFENLNVPHWINIVTLKGTLLIANKPGTIALGRIRDQKTWLSLIADIDIWFLRSFFQIGLCFQWVDGGDFGFGIIVRVEGGATMGILRLTCHAGFGLVYA